MKNNFVDSKEAKALLEKGISIIEDIEHKRRLE